MGEEKGFAAAATHKKGGYGFLRKNPKLWGETVQSPGEGDARSAAADCRAFLGRTLRVSGLGFRVQG